MKPSDRFDDWTAPDPNHLEFTAWGWLVSYPEGLTVHGPADIGAFTYINARHGVDIYTDAQIGSHCAIHSSSSIDDKHGPILISGDAHVGSHSTVMPGVTIASGATVAAHSFVTESVPKDTLVGGVPAEVLE